MNLDGQLKQIKKEMKEYIENNLHIDICDFQKSAIGCINFLLFKIIDLQSQISELKVNHTLIK